MNKKKKSPFFPFFLGFISALIIGWWIFPNIIFSKQEQPFNFSHKAHIEQLGDCSACHFFRDDGSFSGIPSLESCASCHAEPITGTPDEKLFVQEYVKKNKEVPWKIYQKQPDNVYFSHIAHQKYKCTTCHPDVGNLETMPVYRENKITGYTNYTMKMQRCERCHAQNNVSNACYICHK